MIHSVPTIRVLLSLVVALPLLIGGCSTFSGYPQRNDDTKAELKELEQLYFGPNVLLQYEALTPGSLERRAYRDRVINGRILAIDDNYQAFVKKFSSFENGSNLAAGFTGFRGSVDKNLFYQKTWPVFVSQMDALRLAQLVKIRSGLQRSDDEYPLTQGLVDLQNYYTAGSLPGAITGIALSSRNTSTKANEQLRNLKASYSYTDDSATLRNYWKPGGTVDPAHAAAFNDWLSKNEPGVDIATFIYSSKYAGARSRAVADLVSGQSVPTREVKPGVSTNKKTSGTNNAPLPKSDSDIIRNYWKPNGVVNAEHAAALKAWLDENAQGIDIATFIYSPKYAAERAKAVAALIK